MSWLSSWLDHQGGVGKAINSIGGPIVNAVGGAAHSIPVVGQIEDALRAAGGGLGGDPSGAAPGLSGIVGGPGGSSGESPWMNAMNLAQGINAAQLGAKSSNFADQAANSVKDAYAAKSGLRSSGIAGMLNPQTQDLSGLDTISQAGNPFARVASTSGTPLPPQNTGPTVGMPPSGPAPLSGLLGGPGVRTGPVAPPAGIQGVLQGGLGVGSPPMGNSPRPYLT